MITLLSLSAISISVYIAYLINCTLKNNVKNANFLYEFAISLQKNSYTELKPVYRVFSETYNTFYSLDKHFDTANEVIDFIKTNFHKNTALSLIIECLSKHTKACEADIDLIVNELKEAANQYQSIERQRYAQSGKNSYCVFPSITAMIILILI